MKAEDIKEYNLAEDVPDPLYDFPSLLIPFYLYVLNRDTAPSPQQLEQMFYAMYSGGSISNINISNIPKSAVSIKIQKEYNKIARNFRLFLDCRESCDQAIFSFEMTEKYGILFELVHRGNKYWIVEKEVNAPEGVNQIMIEGDFDADGIKAYIDAITKSGAISW